MASTAGQIILAAYQEIGYYGASETLNASDSALGLDQLNKMLDFLSNQSLACFSILEQSFALQVGKTSYTIGTTGSPDINATRPLRIIEGPGAAYLQDTNGNNYYVNVVTRDVWNQIGNRTNLSQSNIPDTLFYDPQFPLGVINIFPSPTSTYTMFFDSYRQLSSLANTSTSLSLPPGYEAMLQHNLAVWLAPFCKNAKVSDDVRKLANDTLAAVKRTNKRTSQAQYDLGINGEQGYFDIYRYAYTNRG